MVGVAGRSKGCVTCRKRKKGCDSRIPSCSQCIERNIPCGGYDLDRIFIASKYERSSPPLKTPPVPHGDSKMDLVIPASLARTAFSAKIMEAVFDMFPAYEDVGGSMRSINQFAGILATLSRREEALRQTILAIGLVTLGKGSNDQTVVRQGQALYGKAMQEVGVALHSPQRQKSEALLATARLLGLYEILYGSDLTQSTQARNWMSHAQGEMALIVSRGPEAFTTDPAHLLFNLARYKAAITGVRIRRRVVFNEERWKTTPWQGRTKYATDFILDILLQIPEILQDLDYIDALPPDNPRFNNLRLKVIAKCWNTHCQLVAWSTKYSDGFYQTDVEAPITIDFPNLGLASMSLKYWATATLLYHSLDRALRFSPHDNLEPYVDRPNARPFARLIVRSVRWLFRKENGVTGATAVSFPLGVALMYLKQSEVPDEDYMSLVFSVWSDPEWPSSIKDFLRSMGNAIKLPTRQIPDSSVAWSSRELEPIFDVDGNKLSGPDPSATRVHEVK